MQQRGFTLAEIMIVIVIVTTISVFLVRNFTKEARTTIVDRAAAQIIDIRRAVLSHFVTVGSWPDAQGYLMKFAINMASRKLFSHPAIFRIAL